MLCLFGVEAHQARQEQTGEIVRQREEEGEGMCILEGEGGEERRGGQLYAKGRRTEELECL